MRRFFLFCLVAALLGASNASAYQGTTAPFSVESVSPYSFPAGANGVTLTLNGNFPAFSAQTYGMCFFTGYGPTAPLIPTGNANSATLNVPASYVQSVPPETVEENGGFQAAVYIAQAGSTCDGNATLSNAVTVILVQPSIQDVLLQAVSQNNPALTASANPTSFEVGGDAFLASPVSQVLFTYGPGNNTPVAAASVAYVNTTTSEDPNFGFLNSTIASPPQGATTVDIAVCNGATTPYCSDPVTLPVLPLMTSSGTLSATPGAPTPTQTVSLAATFAPAGASAAGAPSGMATFMNGSTLLGTAPLALDASRASLAPGDPAYIVTGEGSLLVKSPVRTQAHKAARARAQARPRDVPFGSVNGLTPYIADFNHDGLPDVLILDPANNNFHFLLGTIPRGDYLPAGDVYPSDDCEEYVDAAVGDLNGDGYPDLVFLCANSTDTEQPTFELYSALNNLGGGFTTSTDLGTVFGSQVTLGDFNHDGKLDIVVAGAMDDEGDSGFTVFLGDGRGGVTAGPVTTSTVANGFQMRAADFNQDGYADLAILYGEGEAQPNLYTLQNDGTGRFLTAAVAATGLSSSAGFTLGALSGSFPSLLVVDPGAAQVEIVRNLQSSTIGFAAPVPYAVSNLRSAVPGDFNGDGKLDIATYNGANLGVLTGDGQGTFTATPINTVASNLTLLAGVDENADGYADMLAYAPPTSEETLGTLTNYVVSGTATATLTAGPFMPGSYTLTASTPGTVTLLGSTGSTSVNVAPVIATPTVTLASGPNPSTFGQQVTLTATISGGTAGTPTGMVTFFDGMGSLGMVNLSNGTASLSTSSLSIGNHVLTARYSGDANYATATSPQNTQVVSAASSQVSLGSGPNPSTYGQQVTLTATVSGGTAGTPTGMVTFFDGAGSLGMVNLSNGMASLSTASLNAGSHALTAMYGGDSHFASGTSMQNVQVVSQAKPQLTWATPDPLVAGSMLTPTQLNATAAGVTGAALAGTFTYTPAAGSLVQSGTQTLSVLFTPADAVDYTTAAASVQLVGTPLTLTGLSSTSALLGDTNKAVTLTGTGFLSTSVVQVNGAPLPAANVTYTSGTTLSATIPSSYFLTVQKLQITVSDPVQGLLSNAQTLSVTAPPVGVVFSGPSSAQPTQQPSATLQLSNPYPVPLTGTITLGFTPTAGAPDDPAIQFAQGGRTLSFQIAANSTLTPVVQFQAGTVAGTINLTLALTAGGVNVTPTTLQPIAIQIPAAAPGISSVTFTQSGTTVTVNVIGYSNTVQVGQAAFHFASVDGGGLDNPDVTVQATPLFAAWYGSSASAAYGSQFTYTQVFNLSRNTAIQQVSVTLTNSAGTSASAGTP